jgi:K+/H+ antiporter YhaU regulatory subunit KhtT
MGGIMKMTEERQTTIARYLKIAVDIAARIVSGDMTEGEKLKGRSILSTEYNVSPETIRRSMSILSDKDVVRIIAGSGIVVLSREKAIEFVTSFKDDEVLSQLNVSLLHLVERRKSLDEEIFSTTKQLLTMYRYRRTDLITPVEIDLPRNSHIIGKSIGALQVWHNTGATIIGIIQNNNVIISPGPYYEFAPDDKVLIVGDENVIERFNAYVGQQRHVSLPEG